MIPSRVNNLRAPHVINLGAPRARNPRSTHVRNMSYPQKRNLVTPRMINLRALHVVDLDEEPDSCSRDYSESCLVRNPRDCHLSCPRTSRARNLRAGHVINTRACEQSYSCSYHGSGSSREEPRAAHVSKHSSPHTRNLRTPHNLTVLVWIWMRNLRTARGTILRILVCKQYQCLKQMRCHLENATLGLSP